MDNNTLIHDLSSRVPFGLKLNFYGADNCPTLSGVGKEKDGTWKAYIHLSQTSAWYKLDAFKPILFNSITEPITVEGDTFVPIYGILAVGKEKGFLKTEEDERMLYYFLTHPSETDWREDGLLKSPQWVLEVMKMFHINYQLSSDQFIVATNEYE